MNTKNYLTPTKKYKSLISAIHSIYRLVNSTYELKDLISRLSRLICQIFNSQYCQIMLLDSTKKYSTLKCQISNKKKLIFDKKQKISNGLEKKILRTLSAIRKDNTLAIPMICEDIIGLIVIKRNENLPPFDLFNQEMLMTIVEQGIIGIKNLQLYEEQQKIVLGSIKSLVTLLDTRVPQEYTHSPYFSRLVTAIAHQMRLDEKQIESLKYASLLHDTGKADIPLEILTKTTKLTPKEYSIIKTHPVKGAQILRSFQILKPVIPIIMHHHEKFDGTGYPSRLKKGQIPQGARIMAVADAFEAMVYGRPYRERMNIPSAIKEIKKKSGTQFDPKIVEAFLKAIKTVNTKIYLKTDEKKIYNK
ncbi:MAG TPA: HD domain-containing phosphohydrolase [Candidatus Margulisiibacteriota bacterium]|nr:HD domain-containing phosphohydrolase [Candidatus Margulisiibacteriota bacterium]